MSNVRNDKSHLEAGRKLLQQKRYNEALAELEKQQPRPEILISLESCKANCYAGLNQFQKAFDLLRPLENKCRSDFEKNILYTAFAHYWEGRYRVSKNPGDLENLKKASDRNPQKSLQTEIQLISYYVHKGEYAAALTLIETNRDKYAKDSRALELLNVNYQFIKKKMQEISQQPQSSKGISNVEVKQSTTGNYGNMLVQANFNKFNIKKENLDLPTTENVVDYLNYLMLLEKIGECEKAEEIYHSTLFIKFPYCWKGYINCAVMLQKKQECYQQSVDVLEKMLSVHNTFINSEEITAEDKSILGPKIEHLRAVYNALAIGYTKINNKEKARQFDELGKQLKHGASFSTAAKSLDGNLKKQAEYYDLARKLNVERFERLHPAETAQPSLVSMEDGKDEVPLTVNKQSLINQNDEASAKGESDSTHKLTKKKKKKSKKKEKKAVAPKMAFIIEEPKFDNAINYINSLEEPQVESTELRTSEQPTETEEIVSSDPISSRIISPEVSPIKITKIENNIASNSIFTCRNITLFASVTVATTAWIIHNSFNSPNSP